MPGRASRLFYGGYALGVSWLLPLALLAGVLIVWTRRGKPRTDLLRAGALMWLVWTAGHVAVFSVLYHLNDYYTAILVPAIGALVGSGAVWAWRAASRWVAPVALAGSTAYGVVLLAVAGSSWTWLRVAAAITGATAAVVLCVRALTAARGGARAVTWIAVALATAALLITPAVGSLAMDTHDGGPYTFGFAQRGLGARIHTGDQSLAARYGRPVRRLLGYVDPRTGGEQCLIATSGSGPAASLIAATGRAVLPIGGYLTTMPKPTLAQIRHLIAIRQLRFVAALPHSHDPRIHWVLRNCRLIPGYPLRSDSSKSVSLLYDCALRPVPPVARSRPESVR